MEVNDKTIQDTLKDNKVVLVDFWAEWCGPCRVLGPTIEELESDFKEKAVIGKLNITDNPETSSKYGVRSIPIILRRRLPMVYQDERIIRRKQH